MHPELARIIELFLDSVRWAVACMQESGYSLPTSAPAWSLNAMPQHGTLRCGATYFKHGYGIAITSDTRTVDFDFGQRGEVDGFDAWRLWNFCIENHVASPFADERSFSVALEAARAAGALVKRHSLYYTTPCNP